LLDYRRNGTAHVRVDYIGRAPLAGSDDRMLMASLRTDGQPANLNGSGAVLVAGSDQAPPQPPPIPQRVAVAAVSRPARQEELEPPAIPPTQRATTLLSANAPLPPSRPFDLGTIPGAADPIAAGPIRRSAMFFAPANPPARSSATKGPFTPDGRIVVKPQ